MDYEALARAYFACWNRRDGAAVGALFAPAGTLRDWDTSAAGAAAVGAANAAIFAAVPGIEITVEQVVVDAPRAAAVAEILVHLHDAEGTVLKARRCAVLARGWLGLPDAACGVRWGADVLTRGLQVADVIEFDAATGLITALRAYKG
jgi:hypothetical protein